MLGVGDMGVPMTRGLQHQRIKPKLFMCLKLETLFTHCLQDHESKSIHVKKFKFFFFGGKGYCTSKV